MYTVSFCQGLIVLWTKGESFWLRLVAIQSRSLTHGPFPIEDCWFPLERPNYRAANQFKETGNLWTLRVSDRFPDAHCMANLCTFPQIYSKLQELWTIYILNQFYNWFSEFSSYHNPQPVGRTFSDVSFRRHYPLVVSLSQDARPILYGGPIQNSGNFQMTKITHKHCPFHGWRTGINTQVAPTTR